jgi:hypothetical protein
MVSEVSIAEMIDMITAINPGTTIDCASRVSLNQTRDCASTGARILRSPSRTDPEKLRAIEVA